MSKEPTAVIISDVHVNINTLPRAMACLKQAFEKARELHTCLIISGDLHDTKANLRAECTNALINFVHYDLDYNNYNPLIYIIVGNHDRINEKASAHSLKFIDRHMGLVVESPRELLVPEGKILLLPYYSDTAELKSVLLETPVQTIIMHQGITGANSGEYFKDPTAIEDFHLAGRRVISGHYHTRQSFAIPNGGLVDYVGNPYTLGFGEANDPEKGFQVLYDDGSLEFISTNLPAHRVISVNMDDPDMTIISGDFKPDDIVKVKVTGPSDILTSVTKDSVHKLIDGLTNFQLELEPSTVTTKVEPTAQMSNNELFDQVIDNSDANEDRKERLKKLWRSM